MNLRKRRALQELHAQSRGLSNVGVSEAFTFYYSILGKVREVSLLLDYVRWDRNQQESLLSITDRATYFVQRLCMADLLKTGPPRLCYHAEFSRSALKDVGSWRLHHGVAGACPCCAGSHQGREMPFTILQDNHSIRRTSKQQD